MEKVRQAIKQFNADLAFKKIELHGQGASTRAQAMLQSRTTEKLRAAREYRRAHAALVELGMAEKDTMLQVLHDDQLWMKNVSAPCSLSAGKERDPWFWTVGRPVGIEIDEWSQEGTYIVIKDLLFDSDMRWQWIV